MNFVFLNDILQQDRSYYPFRVSVWEDCFKSRISCQDLRAVNMGQEHEVDRIYRQQFDRISMDYLSQLSLNFDPECGSLLQGIKITSHHTLKQKWLSLFGKYWLVKDMQNDTDVKKCSG